MKWITTVLMMIAFGSTTFAQDRLFAYTYQSNVLNQGDFDIEFQNTLQTGKKGDYSPYLFGQFLKQRIEFEVGLGHKLQTAFYFNTELFHFADTSSDAMQQELELNFSNEWKWKISDPVANGIGCALYGELEVGGSNLEFEGKLILDKQLQEDLIAFNLTGKYEIEKEVSSLNNQTKVEQTSNSPVELYAAYLHQFKQTFALGIEARNNNDITKEDGWINSVLFAGPAMHVSVGNAFINISALPQLINLHQTAASPGNMDLNDFEKAEFRVLAGFDF